MRPLKVQRSVKDGPEKKIEDDLRDFLKLRDWFVIKTHGSQFQSGLPDLFACHCSFGGRWIEVKNPEHFAFTPAQTEVFPKMIAHGVGVWVLMAATEDEYEKLFKPSNYWQFLSVSKSTRQLC